ncbi:MAG TPA: glycosyltransferase 87 family protein, partial [Candidatus Acidoferrum sp.]|nr:glycosyltransferase 87 family protein [Candidatus Acidoferrum sp.]
VSYIVALVVLSALAVVAGALLADAFAMPRWFGILLAIAWAPIKLSVINGQNETFALVLLALAILAAKNDRKLLLGLAIGALLYKPTIGLPFAVLLLLRKEWRALTVVGLWAFVWYLAGVLATAGQWSWPVQYVGTLHDFAHADFVENAARSVGLPDVLMQAGMAMPYAVVAGVLLFLASIPRLIRADFVSALAIVSVLCVAISPHAWHYAPAISLSVIFYIMRNVAEPARTWIVAGAYVIGCISLIHLPGYTTWNPEAIVVLGLTAVVLSPLAGEEATHVPQHQGSS